MCHHIYVVMSNAYRVCHSLAKNIAEWKTKPITSFFSTIYDMLPSHRSKTLIDLSFVVTRILAKCIHKKVTTPCCFDRGSAMENFAMLIFSDYFLLIRFMCGYALHLLNLSTYLCFHGNYFLCEWGRILKEILK